MQAPAVQPKTNQGAPRIEERPGQPRASLGNRTPDLRITSDCYPRIETILLVPSGVRWSTPAQFKPASAHFHGHGQTPAYLGVLQLAMQLSSNQATVTTERPIRAVGRMLIAATTGSLQSRSPKPPVPLTRPSNCYRPPTG